MSMHAARVNPEPVPPPKPSYRVWSSRSAHSWALTEEEAIELYHELWQLLVRDPNGPLNGYIHPEPAASW